jgi:hypothetical protein
MDEVDSHREFATRQVDEESPSMVQSRANCAHDVKETIKNAQEAKDSEPSER